MGAILDSRRCRSQQRLDDLRKDLIDADSTIAGKGCVYATGSFARGEASDYSDLDLFIVGRSKPKEGKIERLLPQLDETCIKADLISVTRRKNIPDFSGDGEYLKHYTVAELIKSLGTPEDDASNTFTARLLLLLESRPLLGTDVYEEAIHQTVEAYWRDFDRHKADFIPAFLTNDILRLWRTFCVNYEARTKSEPDLQRAKRKLKNYKLKHSRLLTCYSALLYLMATWMRAKTVTPTDAVAMASLTPTQRLEALRHDASLQSAHACIDGLLHRYERFLEETNRPESELLEQLQDADSSGMKLGDTSDFGARMFDALELIGQRSLFHRMLVV